MNYVVVKTNNTVTVCDGEFENMKEDVGGYVEQVRPRAFPADFTMFVNEDGHMKKLPVNTWATYFCGTAIVGDVVIVKEKKVMDGLDIASMSDVEAGHWLWLIRGWFKRIT